MALFLPNRFFQNFFRNLQKPFFIFLPSSIYILRPYKNPVQNPPDVRVEARRGDAESEIADRGGGVVADAGDCLEFFHRGWKAAVMVSLSNHTAALSSFDELRMTTPYNHPRRIPQSQCAAVVPHAAPGEEYIAIRCSSERIDSRKLLEELSVRRDHPRHLCLLEHDFGNQNAVRPVVRIGDDEVAPGQSALMDAIPTPDLCHKSTDTVGALHEGSIAIDWWKPYSLDCPHS